MSNNIMEVINLHIAPMISAVMKLEKVSASKVCSSLGIQRSVLNPSSKGCPNDANPLILTIIDICQYLHFKTSSLFPEDGNYENGVLRPVIMLGYNFVSVKKEDFAKAFRELVDKYTFSKKWGSTSYNAYTAEKSEDIQIPTLYHLFEILRYMNITMHDFFKAIENNAEERAKLEERAKYLKQK